MKNRILAKTYLLMLLVLVIGALGMKAPNRTIPTIMCGVSIAWFALFFIANRERIFNLRRYVTPVRIKKDATAWTSQEDRLVVIFKEVKRSDG